MGVPGINVPDGDPETAGDGPGSGSPGHGQGMTRAGCDWGSGYDTGGVLRDASPRTGPDIGPMANVPDSGPRGYPCGCPEYDPEGDLGGGPWINPHMGLAGDPEVRPVGKPCYNNKTITQQHATYQNATVHNCFNILYIIWTTCNKITKSRQRRNATQRF